MVASLDGGPAVRLVASTSKARVLEGPPALPGWLDTHGAAVRSRHASSLRSGRRSSSRTCCADEHGAAAFSASASGTLAISTGTTRRFEMSWFDRSGRKGSAVGDPGPWAQMALSPDDRQLAVQRDNTAAGDIWLFDLVRSVSSKFTADGGNNGPVWSPDGRSSPSATTGEP